MKNIFREYYEPTEQELNEAWGKGLFAFDANTLLNLYRYKSETNEDFFKTLDKIKDRIWIPYQAAYEFHNNRLIVIDNIRKSYKSISEEIDKSYKTIENKLNEYKDHPTINKDEIKNKISVHLESVKEDLKKLEIDHPDFIKEDLILNKIGNVITDNKIGTEFNPEEYDKIFKDGEKRYNDKIPPGYSDYNNKKNEPKRSLYGDLIIWKELIKKISTKKQPIIFVTDDRKEDWWFKHNGQTIRPREELIKEFYKETGIRILIYQADRFLKYAKEQLQIDIKDAAIEDVTNVRKADENTILLKTESDLNIDIKKYLLKGNNMFINEDDYSIIDTSEPLYRAINNRKKSNNSTTINAIDYIKSILYNDRFKSEKSIHSPLSEYEFELSKRLNKINNDDNENNEQNSKIE